MEKILKGRANYKPFLVVNLRFGKPKWVHVSARVGSISDNRKGGWYSYRASKAALNQVIRTFDNQLLFNKSSCICVGVHPGTVKTDLSKVFWESVPKEQLFEADYAAERLIDVVSKLREGQNEFYCYMTSGTPPYFLNKGSYCLCA